jgi:uncharacterized membrane protein
MPGTRYAAGQTGTYAGLICMETTPLPRKAVLIPALAVVLLMLFTLLVLLSPAPSMGMWLMLTLPLALLLPGLRENRPRSLQWLGFVVLFYFTTGVLQLFSASNLFRLLGLFTIACCLGLFVTAIVTLRRQRLARAPQMPPSNEDAQA